VIASGLYEISFGFFTREKPEIQLMVNNEVIKTSKAANKHTSNANISEFNTNLHSGSNIAGLTCIDFLVLTPRSKININYRGEKGGEGFISLRKM